MEACIMMYSESKNEVICHEEGLKLPPLFQNLYENCSTSMHFLLLVVFIKNNFYILFFYLSLMYIALQEEENVERCFFVVTLSVPTTCMCI